MRYEDLIRVDLMQGKITYTDYIGMTFYGRTQKKRERVFEIFKSGEYYGTIKMECEFIKSGYVADKLRTAAMMLFPGITNCPANSYEITNPQSWSIVGNKTMSASRDFMSLNIH